jgi:hypothetical protein
LPISGVHRGTLAALRYARWLSDDVTAVHVSIDPVEAEKIRHKWELWGDGVRLVVLESPYRQLLEPLLSYIQEIADRRQPNETVTIVVPSFVPRRWWTNLLHTQAAFMLRLALMFKPGIVITEVPYLVEEGPEATGEKAAAWGLSWPTGSLWGETGWSSWTRCHRLLRTCLLTSEGAL